MDFSWSETQTALYSQVLEFGRKQLTPLARERGLSRAFSREEWRLCGNLGVLGLPVAEEYGGMGLDALTSAHVIEALGRGCVDAGLVFSISAHLFACVMPIFEHASDDLKRELLPRLCSGEWIGANAITEAGAGSDVFALKTRAVQEGDHFILNGEKSYVSNGPAADVFMTYAMSRPEDGYMGIDAFAVPRDTPGLIVGQPFEKMGLNSSPVCAVYFQDCHVPVSRRLGIGGDGAQIFTSSMHWERSCLFAGYIGLMERQLEETVEYATHRVQTRKVIGKNQAVSHKIADMKLRLEAARLLLYSACWRRDQGQDASLETSLAKLAISEAAIQSSLDAIQLHGGIGFMVETGVERALRDSIPSAIFSGTSEIQRTLIATRLGL